MPRIIVSVKDKIATNLTPDVKIVCRNSDYEVEFQFDEPWSLSNFKTGLFVYNGRIVEQPFDGNICRVPILDNTTLVSIGVKTANCELYTSTPAYVNCRYSFETNTPAPTKDVYDEIINLLNKYISGGGEGVDLRDYQKKVDTSLETTSKEIVGAINEVNSKVEQGGGSGTGGITKETDPTVPSWAKQPQKPTYNYSEIQNKPQLGALASKDYISYDEVENRLTLGTTATTAYKGSSGKANEEAIAELQESKQDNLSFDGIYNATTNKAATVKTVTDKIEEVVAKIDADIQENADKIAENAAAIEETAGNITEALTDAKTYTDEKAVDSVGASVDGNELTIVIKDQAGKELAKTTVELPSGGSADLSGYVKTTDYSSYSTPGIVYTPNGDEVYNGGIYFKDGKPFLVGSARAGGLSDAFFNNPAVYSVPVLSKDLFRWIRVALTTSKETWTDDEKAAARALLGIE